MNYRKINDIVLDDLKQDIISLHSDVQSDLKVAVDSYNTNLSAILDKHAPETCKEITIRPKSQWYAANPRKARVVRRRLERRFEKTGSAEAYRAQCNLYNYMCIEAKTDFQFE